MKIKDVKRHDFLQYNFSFKPGIIFPCAYETKCQCIEISFVSGTKMCLYAYQYHAQPASNRAYIEFDQSDADKLIGMDYKSLQRVFSIKGANNKLNFNLGEAEKKYTYIFQINLKETTKRLKIHSDMLEEEHSALYVFIDDKYVRTTNSEFAIL